MYACIVGQSVLTRCDQNQMQIEMSGWRVQHCTKSSNMNYNWFGNLMKKMADKVIGSKKALRSMGLQTLANIVSKNLEKHNYLLLQQNI